MVEEEDTVVEHTEVGDTEVGDMEDMAEGDMAVAAGEHITMEEVGVGVVGMVVGVVGMAFLTDGIPLLHSVIGIGGAIRYVL